MAILMIVTSNQHMGATEIKTGLWLEEWLTPFYMLRDQGHDITTASPKGGQVPLDPTSLEAMMDHPNYQRFQGDLEAAKHLSHSAVLSDINPHAYDAVFIPGGHGLLWDLVNLPELDALLQHYWHQQTPIASLCHGPAVLTSLKDDQDRSYLHDRHITGFSDHEETLVNFENQVPFLLEEKLKSLGAHYHSTDAWQSYVVEDGHLLTGQNPASSAALATLLLQYLEQH